MRPLDENKRSVVRGLEAQSFWRAKREQNFLESCHECSEVRADYGGPYKARPRERVENEVRLDAGYCRNAVVLASEARVGDRKIAVEFRQ